MPILHIPQSGQTISCADGENLLRALRGTDVLIENPCGGAGVCGKCRIKIISGTPSALTDEEQTFLKPEEIERGIRLACMVQVEGDLVLELPQKEQGSKVLTHGYLPDFEKDPSLDGLGVAVDIGTTTVVAALIDLKTGEELASASEINAQKQFGLDVLTRITYLYNAR